MYVTEGAIAKAKEEGIAPDAFYCMQLLEETGKVLYCTVLYCTVLYCTVLYCTVLYCTVLYCTVLYVQSTAHSLYCNLGIIKFYML